MATRDIRMLGDEILRKKSREVKELTPRIKELINDMFDTMYKEDGVGLAAVQVGVLRRIIVIDVGGDKKREPICLINPEVVFQEGEVITSEGCLSVPEISGKVARPEHVIVEGLDENFEKVTIDATGLLAKALMHEIDHLDGIVFVDIMLEEDTGKESDDQYEPEEIEIENAIDE